jgi:hypothetical protein
MVTVTQAAPTVTPAVTVTSTANAQGRGHPDKRGWRLCRRYGHPRRQLVEERRVAVLRGHAGQHGYEQHHRQQQLHGPGHREPGGGRMRSRSAPQEYHGEAYGELAAPCAAFAPGGNARRNPLDDHGVILLTAASPAGRDRSQPIGSASASRPSTVNGQRPSAMTVKGSAGTTSVHPAGSESSSPFSSCRWTRSSPQFWRCATNSKS